MYKPTRAKRREQEIPVGETSIYFLEQHSEWMTANGFSRVEEFEAKIHRGIGAEGVQLASKPGGANHNCGP